MATGTYAVNNVAFALMPTTGRWMPRNLIGISGDGHDIYGRTREFQLRWGLASPSEFNQWYTWFNSIGVTGTVVFSLPQYGAATYEFKNYSGCTISEPNIGEYFTENHREVAITLRNIVA